MDNAKIYRSPQLARIAALFWIGWWRLGHTLNG